jgi:hypothetical protein
MEVTPGKSNILRLLLFLDIANILLLFSENNFTSSKPIPELVPVIIIFFDIE